MATTPKPFDPERPYCLSEDEHYRLYTAQHVLAVVSALALTSTEAPARDQHVDIPRESLGVLASLLCTQIEEAIQTPAQKERRHV